MRKPRSSRRYRPARRQLDLPPPKLDREIAQALQPLINRPAIATADIITRIGSERILLVIAAAAWAASRLQADRKRREAASHVLTSLATASLFDHLSKHVFARQRPFLSLPDRERRQVPVSKGPYDSFLSGHAVHVGALAAALSRIWPEWRAPIWIGSGALAATRLYLFAHWFTDVAAGLLVGVGIEKANWAARRAVKSARR
ncbi:MAG: phosphatase PAP2 family protein [Pseudolabrys sp.]|nr:phosphatase PAP2 family protein [Pseudolabrys sp.]